MPSDVIVPLGGGILRNGELPDSAKYRVDEAVKRFKRGDAQHIAMSGGLPHGLSYVPHRTESRAMGEYAISQGVPPERIFYEERSSDTIGNIYYVKTELLIPNGWYDATILTSDFHALRAGLIAGRVLGPEFRIRLVGVPSGLPASQLEEKVKEEERKYKYLVNNLFKGIKPGDHEAVKRILDARQSPQLVEAN